MIRPRLVGLRLVAAILGLGPAAFAQIPPGQSIATMANTGNPPSADLFRIDHAKAVAVRLQISSALRAARANTVLMLAPSFGFVGTVGNTTTGAPGDVYRITISGDKVTETKLNTTPLKGSNTAQFVMVSGRLYFTTQRGRTGGSLQSMSLGGGAVTEELDLSTVGATELANAVAAIGTKVYVATFNSSSTPTRTGEIVVYDTVTKKGSLLMRLPRGKRQFSATGFFNTGIVNMHARGGLLYLLGVYGDLLVVDPAAKKVLRHDFTAPRTSPTLTGFNLVNSFAWDTDRDDWIVGSRDAHVERIVDGNAAEGTNGHSAEKIVKLAAAGSVNGLHHFPAGNRGKDRHIGAGCPGKGGFTLTDASFGLPTLGNAGFAIGLYSGTGGAPYAVVVGARQTPPIDLAPIGMTPACYLRTTLVATVSGTLTGSGNGNGKAKIPLPIPNDPTAKGAKITRQAAEVQLTGKTNALGVVVSNAREMELR